MFERNVNFLTFGILNKKLSRVQMFDNFQTYNNLKVQISQRNLLIEMENLRQTLAALYDEGSKMDFSLVNPSPHSASHPLLLCEKWSKCCKVCCVRISASAWSYRDEPRRAVGLYYSFFFFLIERRENAGNEQLCGS